MGVLLPPNMGQDTSTYCLWLQDRLYNSGWCQSHLRHCPFVPRLWQFPEDDSKRSHSIQISILWPFSSRWKWNVLRKGRLWQMPKWSHTGHPVPLDLDFCLPSKFWAHFLLMALPCLFDIDHSNILGSDWVYFLHLRDGQTRQVDRDKNITLITDEAGVKWTRSC